MTPPTASQPRPLSAVEHAHFTFLGHELLEFPVVVDDPHELLELGAVLGRLLVHLLLQGQHLGLSIIPGDGKGEGQGQRGCVHILQRFITVRAYVFNAFAVLKLFKLL